MIYILLLFHVRYFKLGMVLGTIDPIALIAFHFLQYLLSRIHFLHYLHYLHFLHYLHYLHFLHFFFALLTFLALPISLTCITYIICINCYLSHIINPKKVLKDLTNAISKRDTTYLVITISHSTTSY